MVKSSVRIQHFLAVAVVALVLTSRAAIGSQGSLPPTTLQTLQGRWEGINFEQPRVLVVRICGQSDSIVAMAAGGGAYWYRSRSVVVSDGTAVIEAVNEHGERLSIRAHGGAISDAGRMDGKVTWYDTDGSPVVMPMTFFKEPGGYVDRLRSLVERAELASPGRGTPLPPLPQQ